jgi:hypothetical protein
MPHSKTDQHCDETYVRLDTLSCSCRTDMLRQIPPWRGAVYAAFLIAALAFAVAALPTKIATFEDRSGIIPVGVPGGDIVRHARANLWYLCLQESGPEASPAASLSVCISATDTALECRTFLNSFRAMQAFSLITVIFLVISAVFGVLDQTNTGSSPRYKTLLVIMALLCIGLSIAAWALSVVTTRETFCDGDEDREVRSMSSQPNFKWGPSPFLMLAATLWAVAALFAAGMMDTPLDRATTLREGSSDFAAQGV